MEIILTIAVIGITLIIIAWVTEVLSARIERLERLDRSNGIRLDSSFERIVENYQGMIQIKAEIKALIEHLKLEMVNLPEPKKQVEVRKKGGKA